LRAWLADNGQGTGAGEQGPGSDVSEPAAEDGAGLAVVFPDEGDVFRIDPDVSRTAQAVRLRAVAQEPGDELVWVMDGRELARGRQSDPVFWALEPGRHSLAVRSGAATSAAVEFTVLQ
jgi:membrane carboxypeptidase/penicillin-binding protein PbpC